MMKNSPNKGKFEILLKDTKNVLIATDNGIAIVGEPMHILFMFGNLVKKLNEDIPKKHLRVAFELGLGEEKNE